MANLSNMSPAAMAAWSALLQKYPDLQIRSAYRDPAHNKKVGGANKSQHIHGNAFDVSVAHMPREERIKLIRDAQAVGFNGVGVYNNSLHFDVGPARAWGSSYKSDSIPDWAKPHLYLNGNAPPAPSDKLTFGPDVPKMDPGVPTPKPGALGFPGLDAIFNPEPRSPFELLAAFGQNMGGNQQQAQAPPPPPIPNRTIKPLQRPSSSYAQSLLKLILG